MMPVMDGLTFLAERSRRGLAASVPVLCLSSADREMTAYAIRLGARECLPKPSDVDTLCDRISHYSGLAALAASARSTSKRGIDQKTTGENSVAHSSHTNGVWHPDLQNPRE